MQPGEEKPLGAQQRHPEDEAARLLSNLRDHGFASSNEQYGFALGQSHKQEPLANSINASDEQ